MNGPGISWSIRSDRDDSQSVMLSSPVLGGILIGLCVGGLTRLVLMMTHDSSSEIAVTLLGLLPCLSHS